MGCLISYVLIMEQNFVFASLYRSYLKIDVVRRTSRAPWRQTTSTKNYRAERLWPEENARVNYPLKRALNFSKEQEIFNMEDPLVSFAVSWVTLHVSKVGSENFVNSWNYHRIPGEFWCFRRRPFNFYVDVIFSLNFINHDYVFIVTYLFFM